MNGIAPTSPYGIANCEPNIDGMMPCGLVCAPNAHSTALQMPPAISAVAVWIMPHTVAPPMSMVEQ